MVTKYLSHYMFIKKKDLYSCAVHLGSLKTFGRRQLDILGASRTADERIHFSTNFQTG